MTKISGLVNEHDVTTAFEEEAPDTRMEAKFLKVSK